MEAAYRSIPTGRHWPMEHLDAATHADFMDFYETFYVPRTRP